MTTDYTSRIENLSCDSAWSDQILSKSGGLYMMNEQAEYRYKIADDNEIKVSLGEYDAFLNLDDTASCIDLIDAITPPICNVTTFEILILIGKLKKME